MIFRSSLVTILGLGTLIVICGVLGFSALDRGSALYEQTLRTHTGWQETQRLLEGIPEDLHLSGIHVRDYLLDPAGIAGDWYREQIVQLRARLSSRLAKLEESADPEVAAQIPGLHKEIDAYWESLEPVFRWTPQQRFAFGHGFLRQTVLPRRNAVLALADQIGTLQAVNLTRTQQRLRQSQTQFERVVLRLTGIAVFVGVAVMLLTMRRVYTLERAGQTERARIQEAEAELRRLSQRLVKAQEEERKALSRELHDEIGQSLTGLRMELNSLGTVRSGPPERFDERIREARGLIERTIRSVRDLAMGLRPSMLDDIGLGPALEWLGRDFSRRGTVAVAVQIDGTLDHLPEAHRTCVFRIVQEALTNCARHAGARNIRVNVHGGESRVSLTVQDDGVGFPDGRERSGGLGLLGIKERVNELGGSFKISSQPFRGAMLAVELPVEAGVMNAG
jgi:signal transduction histidine kinase